MIDAQFRFNQCNSFREENISILPIWSCVNTMTCGGSHLGFPSLILNKILTKVYIVLMECVQYNTW